MQTSTFLSRINIDSPCRNSRTIWDVCSFTALSKSIPNSQKYDFEHAAMNLKDEYSQQIGTFEYLPVNFLGINTSTFTDSYIPDDKEHPFLSLKRFAMDNSISFEDRIQCVRSWFVERQASSHP